ncbi:MAG: divalent-cation tolerance protein CutA [Hyphomicrobiales bacterium]|nr:divalent-cation tolerance protein CutA [Hyphomicrobiales bacterium]
MSQSSECQSSIIMIYTTFASKAEAKKAGADLVERRLAACVNIFPPMTSIYEWEGEVQTTREAAMIVKTVFGLQNAVYTALKATHPYSIPAFVVYPASASSVEFEAWVKQQTQSPPKGV